MAVGVGDGIVKGDFVGDGVTVDVGVGVGEPGDGVTVDVGVTVGVGVFVGVLVGVGDLGGVLLGVLVGVGVGDATIGVKRYTEESCEVPPTVHNLTK